MDKRSKLEELNVIKHCKNYGVPLIKCPQFLFLLMGVIIVGIILFTFFVGDQVFGEPLLVLGIITGEAILLFVVGYAVIGGFEKMAEANRMKDDFVDLVTHQLRSPLTTLKWGFQDLKEEMDTDEEQEKYFESLQGNVEKMTDMVNNLLLVSKMDQEGHKFEKEKFSINELLEGVLKDYMIDEDSTVSVEKKIEKVPNIFSDPSQLEIVMDNFISNAIKYTKEGGEVKVRLGADNKYILFEVEDNGIGIPKEDQKKVFEKFERAKNVDKVQESGSGLGLFLTKEIVEKLGGKIGFESEEDEGSTFWFKLPMK